MDLTKHSPFPWYLHREAMVIMSGEGTDARAVAYASQPDIEIILSATNNTYGKGIDPTKWMLSPDDGSGKKCLNCRHWRDKAWVDKGWGICDNPKNETKISLRGMITNYMRNLPDPEKDQMIEELVAEVEDGIRYPEDFGCTFFEPII